jgi:hypothetical protein
VTERRAWIPAALILTVVYAATMAPTVTFWDAGEFIAAAHSLGIPHPPGTPLYIILLHTWGLPWPNEAYAAATNLFSVFATIAAAALSSTLVFRWLQARWDDRAALAGATASAICAGTMFTAWSNATETEVYAASLALAAIMLFAAERRRERLVAYCFGLAAALHVSALVASPAAILLAATRDEELDWGIALRLTGTAVAAMAIGTWNPWMGVVALGVMAAAICHPEPFRRGATNGLGMTMLVILGASPLLFMLIRARFDPGINQGNPATLQAFFDVIARRQYELAPLWPRRAPTWLQLANWFEYADWQTALSLGPGVMPTIPRTTVTLAFAALAMVGALEHRRTNRRSWRAMLALFVAGTVGVTLYLNLRASPSFGWGVLPDGAMREARERDYFFVLGFWACGLWAGLGAVTLARRRGWPVIGGVAVAAVPIALNWSAVNRRSEPDSRLALAVASGLVKALPEGTVLFVAGDNDTYPVWFGREVLGERPDVTLVTLPLIGASWYVEELLRRNPELSGARTPSGITSRTIADAARAAGRPVAAALTVDAAARARLNGCWTVIGAVLISLSDETNCSNEENRLESREVALDTVRIREWIRANPALAPSEVKRSIDPVGEYFARVLDCPREVITNQAKRGRGFSLDSTCKL